MHVKPAAFFLIPNCLKTQEMCIRPVKVDLWQLYDVPDWLMVPQETWYENLDDDDDDDDNDDEIIKWYSGDKDASPKKHK